jgi:hypothetical protein
VRSDWVAVERERGISACGDVLAFNCSTRTGCGRRRRYIGVTETACGFPDMKALQLKRGSRYWFAANCTAGNLLDIRGLYRRVGGSWQRAAKASYPMRAGIAAPGNNQRS